MIRPPYWVRHFGFSKCDTRFVISDLVNPYTGNNSASSHPIHGYIMYADYAFSSVCSFSLILMLSPILFVFRLESWISFYSYFALLLLLILTSFFAFVLFSGWVFITRIQLISITCILHILLYIGFWSFLNTGGTIEEHI